MFTGIVSDVGTIVRLEARSEGGGDLHARIRCGYAPQGIAVGASIACDGICLTVTDRGPDGTGAWFDVDLSAETVARTNVRQGRGAWAEGRRLNLERALRLSDTSPPLYYLLLSGWTRQLGTSDAAVRLFSALWAVATVPVLWLVARRVGGEPAALAAAVLFAINPLGLYYSVEARMYSMVMFLAVSLIALTLRLGDRPVRPWSVARTVFCWTWMTCRKKWMNSGRGRAVLLPLDRSLGRPWPT